MVKAYLRYEPALTFGVIASPESNVCYDPSGRLLLAGALDRLAAWDLKRGLPSVSFAPSSSSPSLAVSCIASSQSAAVSSSIASGHADGSIRLWDAETGACEATLHGHRSAASALRFGPSGAVLASGSKDCDVILWDVVAQAGLFRLRGHRDQVTDLVFLDSGKKLVSCSKDKFIRVWDLETQHCLQIIGGHRSEIWSMDVDPSERFLVSGSADPELRVFRIRQLVEEGEDWSKWDVLKLFGEIPRQNKERVATVRFNRNGSLVACQVAGKTADIYRVLDETEAVRKAKRRMHRKKEKASAKSMIAEGNGTVIDPLPAQDLQNPAVIVTDVFKLLQVLRASKKICSISFSPSNPPRGCLATLSLSLNNNTLETYSVDSEKVSKMHSIEMHGHRSDIRSVSLNSEDNLLMSTSHNAVKIWNPSTGDCLRTIDSGYGLCSSFVGNRFALVGTKSGTLEIIDIASGSLTEVIEAHAGSIRSIVPIPDEDGTVGARGFVTGSADHDVKFWEYQLVNVSLLSISHRMPRDSKQLTVTNVRTLKMTEDVLAVSISPQGKHIAVALLDCNVKVYHMDTLKHFLNLYGHKLPVLCMDISSDGALIVTGSADKNLKIWGMDFGDCHKSIFAHSDSVMDVKFVYRTHYVFSVGKDRTVKYWDADKFELLLTLEGHHAEVWCLTISSRGDFIVTGSHDRSIRRWDRTEEQLFIEEEKEKRLEETFEADLDNDNEYRYGQKDDAPDEGSVGVPGRKTKETVTSADAIMDALDTAEEELKRLNQHKLEEQNNGRAAKFQPNVIMQGHSPSDYVLNVISSIRPNDLEQALLALPFSDALKLMSYLKEWSLVPSKVELVCRVCLVLLQTHHNQLTTTPAARSLLTELKDILYCRVKECKDTIGFNLAAMDHLKELLAMRSDAPFRDAKAKLMEIRQEQSKRSDRPDGNERRKKKKKKASGES
ncbi:WD repeat-containing protein 3 [Dichanthelium oligosanthes]|uniref:WD repeat-containing protein 3 n=1 Tax=Dichanthelium oligosanthes TaxID=888268 RepID=A0A1E5WNJ8_9POAL|nr:WD repeat-containing protein 3 [Dichanthelium oligosanthes]